MSRKKNRPEFPNKTQFKESPIHFHYNIVAFSVTFQIISPQFQYKHTDSHTRPHEWTIEMINVMPNKSTGNAMHAWIPKTSDRQGKLTKKKLQKNRKINIKPRNFKTDQSLMQ